MRVLNDYQCDTCMVTDEEYCDPEIKTLPCACGGTKHQVLHGAGSYFKINGARMDINSYQWGAKREANSKRKNN